MRRFLGLTLTLVFSLSSGLAMAQDEAPASPVKITAVKVTPDEPATDTLCQLRIDLQNTSDKIVSQLAFTVTVEGNELPVYRNQIFMERLDPGATTEVRLYNFWSTETGRAAPTDGNFDVEVVLREASFYTIEDEDDAEVWTPIEAIPGLPESASTKLPMSAGAP